MQLSVQNTVPESDQLINFEDFTPWSLCFCYMTPCNIDAWSWLFFQSVHYKVLTKTYYSEFSKFAIRSHFLSLAHYSMYYKLWHIRNLDIFVIHGIFRTLEN